MSEPNPLLVSLVSQAGERAAGTPVSSLFIGRWSARAMTGEPIPDKVLFALFEAARFAPSSNNSQPWRFAYARRGKPAFDKFHACLSDSNRVWASKASALALVASKAAFTPEGGSEPRVSGSSSFDTGAAWASLAFQAALLGWSTRAMGGFDHDLARAAAGAPESLKLEAMIAIGKRGDPLLLPEERRAFEKPNRRKKIEEIVFAGGFPADC
ncbi:nitroreductase family protein [Rhodoblastus acidophilus]|uniref:Nitroreductase family protein n=1 Tax=Candidatus Rhodoblastus alkanivorans TaxID=2954117 RepID=A0ABS9Z5S6_9HYPH|nr:nitroreductase family protein [Candidatus Rhodoblastus alkanivorans]MCI4680098.1 nitroreductase family protein [Candidatus Rhodoblastus alkanivorans]MCI4682976.1 nitroreductase family protein [Candidatus Rhodoblastus alkanivorans]MDI4640286.1 nitroreductase family protein [Rhodoblastus acidophilus]